MRRRFRRWPWLLAGFAALAGRPSRAQDSKITAIRPEPEGASHLDTAALARLKQRAEQSHSDAIVIYHDGKLVAEWYFDKPPGRIETMSATKSIVSLAVGRLLDTGKLKSLDQPIYELFPEWRQGRKQKITLRHLLNHTSGLQNERTTVVEIYPSPDFVKLALAAELSDPPGEKFAYNNKAVNLLAAVVKLASGQRLDEYVRDQIFTPLGITDFAWALDHSGNPQGMAGLSLRAQDLARIGLMLQSGGVWKGKRIVSQRWISESTSRAGQSLNPRCGLLWWLLQDFRGMAADDKVLAAWRKGGASEDFIRKITPLKDRVFVDRKEFFAAIEQALGGKGSLETWYDNTWRKGLPDGVVLGAPVRGFYADGYLGQYLVVVPSSRLVAVRQMRAPDDDKVDTDQLDSFREFPEMVRALVR
jgi:CubicO group peptidase (beta-lactamase class C family)